SLLASGATALLRAAGPRGVRRRLEESRALAAALGGGPGARGCSAPGVLPACLRVVVGALLLLAAGPAYTAAALVAAALCALALAHAVRRFAQGSEDDPPVCAAVAATAALLAFATVAAAQGILGFTGVPAHLREFDQQDLSWTAALVGVVAACGLLQLAGRAAEPVAAPAAGVRRRG
ncbi:hypothetical protein C5C59_16910, partial [Rathayibacter sp. AY1F4]